MSETSFNQSVRYDSDSGALGGNERHSLATYVSDMLALEKHIREPIDRQIDMVDTAKYGDAVRIISTIRGLVDSHISALQNELERLGGHEASALKEAWAAFVGQGAKLIDSSRKTKVSKNLRDDYTALALCTVSYTMLHATALGLGEELTATLAKRHLEDWTPIIMDINKAIPTVVLQELRDDGEQVVVSADQLALEGSQSAWRSGADRTQL